MLATLAALNALPLAMACYLRRAAARAERVKRLVRFHQLVRLLLVADCGLGAALIFLAPSPRTRTVTALLLAGALARLVFEFY